MRPSKDGGKRVSIFLDGKFAISIGSGVAAREGLRTEQSLTDQQLEALTQLDRYERCLAVATRYLSVRPRSRAELCERLERRGFDSDTRAEVVGKLQIQGLLDDTSFARLWTDSREASRPRSRWLTRLELQKKGVPGDVIDEAVSTIDDEASAYRAALTRVRTLRHAGREEFYRRMSGYLQRRGFAYDVVHRTVDKAWKHRDSLSGDAQTG
jgi:regulatory protein